MHPLIKDWKSWNLRWPSLSCCSHSSSSFRGRRELPRGLHSGHRDPPQAPGFRKLILSRLPGNCLQSAEQSDGDLLAGDALDKALLPVVRVIPDSSAAAGHQALPAEAAAAASSAPFPGSIPSLVNGQPEGKTEERAKEDAGNQAGREVIASFSSSHPSILHRSLWPTLWLSTSFPFAPSQPYRGRETPWS